MRIEYENRFRDLVLFSMTHQFLSIPCQVLFLGFALLIFASEFADSGTSFLSSVLLALMLYVLMWLLQLIFNVAFLWSRKNKSVLTKHSLEVRDDGLLEETAYNRSLFYWPGIVKIVRRPGFIAVYVTPHVAHIVPSRSFESPTDADNFFGAIRAKLRAP